VKKNGSKVKNLGIVLGMLLEHHSLSLTKLANAIGITQPYLSRLVHHQRVNPSIKLVEKISAIFKVSISQLFGEQEIDFKKRPKELDFDCEEGNGC